MRLRVLGVGLALGLALAAGFGCDAPKGSRSQADPAVKRAATKVVEMQEEKFDRPRVTVFYSANVWGELLECG